MGLNTLDYVRTAKENCFVLNGKSSLDFGIVVTDGEDFFKSAERDTDSYEVPGRNGEVSVDNGRYKNVDMTITCAIESDFRDQFIAFKNYVGRQLGYVRLENTFDPEIYQMAKVVSVTPKTLGTRYHAGTFEIKFDAMPQKFLKSGEDALHFILPTDGVLSSNIIMTFGTILGSSNEYSVEVHCPEGMEVEVMVSGMNPTQSQPVKGIRITTAVDGDIITGAASWTDTTHIVFRITSGNSSLDGIWARLQFTSQIDGEDCPVDAILTSEWTLQNPTGFASKPLLQYYNFSIGTFKVTNYTDGIAQEYFQIGSTALSSATYLNLDCDLQYMYDNDGNNLSTDLIITTAQDRKGRNLIFPRFGTDIIVLNFWPDSTDTEIPCLLDIVPRWWRL